MCGPVLSFTVKLSPGISANIPSGGGPLGTSPSEWPISWQSVEASAVESRRMTSS